MLSQKYFVLPGLMVCLFFVFCAKISAGELPKLDVDWPKFMAAQDMVFETMPKDWTQGPFMGNAMIGTLVYQDSDNSVRWEIGRADYYDHRSAAGKYLSSCAISNNGRLPIGYFTLDTVGKITDGSGRLDLWNAESTGVIKTDKGEIKWRTYVHSELMLIAIETQRSDGEKEALFKWHPQKAVCPRVTRFLNTPRDVKGYVENPPYTIDRIKDVSVCIQPLLAGGQTTTAWREIAGKENTATLYVTIEHTYPQADSTELAVQTIKTAISANPRELQKSHQAWWHEFYPKSFLSLPSARYENFYWVQIYKLACATRSGRAFADLNGPWLQKTQWPAIWWNMNVQLTYSPVLVANHPELSDALLECLDKGRQALIDSAPEKYRYNSAYLGRATAPDLIDKGKDPAAGEVELGDLAWTLHNYYMHCRHTMDRDSYNRLLPLLERAMNYYFHFLSEGEDGKLHLAVKTISPEYSKTAEDCNYDLSLIRWGCRTLIDICKKYNIDKPQMPKWQDVLNRLADYPVDENGYMVGRDVPFAETHRHWSHLMMIYPLYTVNIDQPENMELMEKSAAHWFSMQEEWMGFSYPGASSICASLGDGNRALEHLNNLLRPGSAGRTPPNTLSYENGGPIIETALAGARSIQDMLIQSWGDKIRVFPAVPDVWADVEFHQFSAEGGFLVSAKREKGKTIWIRIKSCAGEPCKLKMNMTGDIKIAGLNKRNVNWKEPGLAEIDLKKGQEILLYTTDKLPKESVTGVSYPAEQANFYGVKKSPGS